MNGRPPTLAEQAKGSPWPFACERTASSTGDVLETARWIGPPWRRVELLVQDTHYRGERIDRTWILSWTLGLRRLGLHFDGAVGWARVLDYSEERP